MNKLSNLVDTLGPRLIGIAVAAIAGLVYDKTKGTVVLDADAITALVTAMLTAYALAHRAASSVLNPGDAAKGRVSDGIKEAADSRGSNTVVIPPKR